MGADLSWRAASLLLTLAASGRLRAADGAKLYEGHCVACHQPDGNGAEGLAPPLAGVLAKRAQSTSGREYLAQVLVSGMIGTITSRGVKYNGNMPAATTVRRRAGRGHGPCPRHLQWCFAAPAGRSFSAPPGARR
jgi:mono/diheme cytochrome c family protein